MSCKCSTLWKIKDLYGNKKINLNKDHPIKESYNALICAVSSLADYNDQGLDCEKLNLALSELNSLAKEGTFKVDCLMFIITMYWKVLNNLPELEDLLYVIDRYFELKHRYRFNPLRLNMLKYTL